jgi:hypothetical protein
VSNFRALVEQVAKLAYANPDTLLFFRGQDRDYQGRSNATTLYPPIYRGDAVPAAEIRHRFEVLDEASKLLVERFKSAGVVGHPELRKKRYVQWSILQHYEVTPTPLLDLTHSLRVACSFAQSKGTEPTCYVYVLGLPYLMNRITVNSEHDIVNVRLLSICPPEALRPYFQEAYLAGTSDVTHEFESKTELDFRNRLIAKFAIPRARRFWGSGFDVIPLSALFPTGDRIFDLCKGLREEIKDELRPGEMGEFIKAWAALENYLVTGAKQLTERNLSLREAVRILSQHESLQPQLAREIDTIRVVRNNLVHKPGTVSSDSLGSWLDRLRAVLEALNIQT